MSKARLSKAQMSKARISKVQSSKTEISLAGVRNEMKMINKHLQNKCDESYEIRISQYRHRDESAVVFDEANSHEYQILLCLYHNKRCVSSITGKYNKASSSMILSSKTDAQYEGKKFNLYLRTIFIYLMCFVRPTIQKIVSYATNPISIYTMYKHYHATNSDLQDYVTKHKLTPDTFTLPDAIKFHEEFIESHKQTRESAKKKLDEMLEEMEDNSDEDEEYTVEDLGLGSEEEAIQAIIRTMNVTEIALELNLEDEEKIKERLLTKMRDTNIICKEFRRSGRTSKKSKTLAGGRRKFTRCKTHKKSHKKLIKKTHKKTHKNNTSLL
jgi:hypothetical protein